MASGRFLFPSLPAVGPTFDAGMLARLLREIQLAQIDGVQALPPLPQLGAGWNGDAMNSVCQALEGMTVTRDGMKKAVCPKLPRFGSTYDAPLLQRLVSLLQGVYIQ